MRRRGVLATGMVAAAAAAGLGPPRAGRTAEPSGAWGTVKAALFGDRELADGRGVIRLVAPERAHDAATVPMTVQALAPTSPELRVRSVWLVIDENPAPVAGVFRFPADGGAPPVVETRVRVNQYTPVHAVAETADGRLWAVERFVKAAGGCSAPGLKDAVEAQARLGKMRMRSINPFVPGEPLKVQLLVSHPQYTGMQMDQASRNWIPPDYIQRIEISYAGASVLEVDADISLSEDPSLTFGFVPDAPGELVAEVVDSEGRRFRQSWPLGPGA